MAMAAHDPAMAKKVGIPQGVARDFNQSDQGTPRLSHAMMRQKARAQALRARSKRAAPAADAADQENEGGPFPPR